MTRTILIILLLPSYTLLFGQTDTATVIHTFSNGFKIAKKNDLLGILTEKNEIVYPFKLYNSIKNLNNNLWRIKQEYPDTVKSSYEPGWVAIMRMKYGLINSQTGALILPPVYNYIEMATIDQLLISNDSLTGLLDAKTLNYTLPPVYRKIEVLKNGNFIVVKKDSLYFLNGKYQTINKFANLTRFEPTLTECVYIFRTPVTEGLSDCQGNRFNYKNWREVLDVDNGLVFIKTTEKNLAVYNIVSKKKIIEEPYQNFRLKDNKIYVYLGNKTKTFDLNGRKLQ